MSPSSILGDMTVEEVKMESRPILQIGGKLILTLYDNEMKVRCEGGMSTIIPSALYSLTVIGNKRAQTFRSNVCFQSYRVEKTGGFRY